MAFFFRFVHSSKIHAVEAQNTPMNIPTVLNYLENKFKLNKGKNFIEIVSHSEKGFPVYPYDTVVGRMLPKPFPMVQQKKNKDGSVYYYKINKPLEPYIDNLYTPIEIEAYTSSKNCNSAAASTFETVSI